MLENDSVLYSSLKIYNVQLMQTFNRDRVPKWSSGLERPSLVREVRGSNPALGKKIYWKKFIHNCLASGWQQLVINFGIWIVDKVEEKICN